MWQRWSELLERLGAWRLGLSRFGKGWPVGEPNAPDAEGGLGWKAFARAEPLYRAWGPHPESPWVPFHCVPLFASLDRVKPEWIGPTGRQRLPVPLYLPEGGGPRTGGGEAALFFPPAPEWLNAGTWTILDAPGRLSVEAAAWLIVSGGCQPVCTFDNWPHEKGVLRAGEVLAELLRWAPTVFAARERIEADAPPLWICDSRRLGTRAGRPGEFDNRYFMDDSILPGPGFLARHGVRRVVYLHAEVAEPPVADLENCFSDLLGAGIPVLHLRLPAAAGAAPEPMAGDALRRRPKPRGYRRSAAGGFGTTVPEPSSGSSG